MFEKSAELHWKYVKSVLKTHGVIDENILNMIGFHYQTAMTHGVGHGWELCEKYYVDKINEINPIDIVGEMKVHLLNCNENGEVDTS
jgi:hypothetical protein